MANDAGSGGSAESVKIRNARRAARDKRRRQNVPIPTVKKGTISPLLLPPKPRAVPKTYPAVKPPTSSRSSSKPIARTSTVGRANSSNPRSPVSVVKNSEYQTPEQIAYAAKYRRARQYEKMAAAAKAKLASNSTPVGAPRVAGSSAAPKSSGSARTYSAAERAAYDAKYRRAREYERQAAAVKQKQADASKLKEYMAKASSAVQAELAPALNELNRQIAEMTTRGARQGKQVQDRGERADEDLRQIFGRLGNFMNQVQTTQNDAFGDLTGRLSQQYDKLNSAVGSNYGQALGAANAENTRLGLQGTAPAATQGMARDQVMLQGLAQTDQAAAQGGMAQSQNGFNQLMAMAQGNAQTSGTVLRGQNQNQTAKTLDELMFEISNGTNQLRGKIGDIEQTRGEKIRQLAEALQDKDYSRGMEEQQMRFQQDLAMKRFGLEAQQAQAALTPQPASYVEQLQAAKLQQEIAAEAARQQQAQKDQEWQRAFRALWPNAPGTR